MNSLHVVVGATGTLGSALVQHLHAEGAQVRALARNRDLAESMLPDGVEIRPVDALDAASFTEGVDGAAVVYNCLYAPEHLEKIAGHLLTAAGAAHARLVFPSNPDVYGPPQIYPIPETHPHDATSVRGRRRIALEAMLLAAHERGDVEIVIGRLASFYGAHLHGSLLASVFENARLSRKLFWLGRLDAAHDMLYAPDAAAAFALLGSHADAAGQVWHIPGPGGITGRAFLNMIYTAFGKQPNIGTRSRLFVQLLSYIAPDAKRLLEIMYQFDQPFCMDGTKFAQTFPAFEYTPHEVGIHDTVEWYNAENA
ncbi:MAG: NAD-dependent epimerase/dehydratase family protein [Chloroflexi bacterium]|nr:NAD-dependent epimerase/dehydratase family protein [Chloroflexota bacterium]